MSAIKFVEIRDRGTFIPAMAIRLDPVSEEERWLLARAGYGEDVDTQRGYVLLIQIDGGSGRSECDPYEWARLRYSRRASGRTMASAHVYMLQHWDSLASGDVIDVEYLLGETKTKKTSERLGG